MCGIAMTGCSASPGPSARPKRSPRGSGDFLREELKLELSESKTLITHATSQAASFLGYQIRAQHADTKITRGRRSVNGIMGLFVPHAVIRQRCAGYMRHGKPAPRGPLFHDDDFTIVGKYGAEYRGFVREGADGKGPEPRAPRRRPTSP